jgi:hypothetical protein
MLTSWHQLLQSPAACDCVVCGNGGGEDSHCQIVADGDITDSPTPLFFF